MPIHNYTTTIDYSKTISEIQKCLSEHGASKIMVDYQAGLPVAVSFGIVLDGRFISFQLPAKWQGVLRALKSNKNVPSRLKTDEQALRVAWRIIKDWIVAQMAIVEAELAELAEVFLPYAITSSGTTLYDTMKDNNLKMLTE